MRIKRIYLSYEEIVSLRYMAKEKLARWERIKDRVGEMAESGYVPRLACDELRELIVKLDRAAASALGGQRFMCAEREELYGGSAG